MKAVKHLLLALTVSVGPACLLQKAAQAEDLAAFFRQPPDAAKPHTWWHWMNGNVTRAGITADLEAMKRVGIGGFQAFHVTDRIPPGPVGYMSPAWRALMKHAIQEADRLGLDVCLHNCAGWSSSGGPWITPEYAMQEVVWTELEVTGPRALATRLEKPTTRHDYYRDIAVLAFPTPTGKAQRFRIMDWRMKAGYGRQDDLVPDTRPVPAGAAIPQASVVDLTSQLSDDGTLTWEAPAGHWTVIRFGYTPTGKTNHPAPEEGVGLECDKLSRAAAAFHWQHSMQRVIDDVGPLAGTVFKSVLIDSYEVGYQNWTHDFADTFRERMGYDLRPYLPVLTGRVVNRLDISERFLWDFRRVIADLFAEEYFGYFATMCHRHGMVLSIEPYGKSGNFDNVAVADQADIPMGEWWARAPVRWHHWSGKLAASAAHTHGRRYVGAEAFTAGGSSAAFVNHPYGLKAQGDYFFCQGVNRFTFHTYVHQPWMDVKPGMTMGPHGFQNNRNNTWFESGRAWMRYLARCQYLLQSGLFQADLCYVTGESSPQTIANRWDLRPALPTGFDYDVCSRQTLMRMTVEDGRLVVPGHMQYRVLVLPSGPMRPAVLRKVRDLVRAGACVVGTKPKRAPGLQDYPQNDQEVRRLSAEIWAAGHERVYDTADLASVLTALGIAPDVELRPTQLPEKTLYPGAGFEWIHRRQGRTDVYFLSNQQERAQYLEAVFRVSGKQPQLWDPDTGTMTPAPLYRQTADGRSAVRLFLDPAASVFVVFQDGGGGRSIVDVLHDGQTPYQTVLDGETPSLRILQAVYGVLDGTPQQQVDVTEELQRQVHLGRLRVEVGNQLAGDPASRQVKQLRVTYSLDGKRMTKTRREKETLSLPEETEVLTRAATPPAAELTVSDAAVTLTAWQPGRYDLLYSDHQRHTLRVPQIHSSIDLSEDWTLRFPPGWGAPPEIQLDRLRSWTEHPLPDIQHFSGTAVYRKRFDVPGDVLRQDCVVRLDLGDVQVMAEVILNGHNLGILWKPPFAVEVSTRLQTKNNRLEVRVTNLWANRLIGDATLAEDGQWLAQSGRQGRGLQAIPDWLLRGQPRPPSARKTFATWQHYSGKEALLPSGLIGPVVLRVGSQTIVSRHERR